MESYSAPCRTTRANQSLSPCQATLACVANHNAPGSVKRDRLWERRASRQAHAVCGRELGLSWHQMRLDFCSCSHRPAFSRDGLNDVHWCNDELGGDLHCNFGGLRVTWLPSHLHERGSATEPLTMTTIVQPGSIPGSSWLHRDAPHSPPQFPAGANSILLCRDC
jgi:hypothetical protein